MQIRAGGNAIRLQGNTRPYNDNTFDLGLGGGSPLRWKDLYLTGSIYFGSDARIYQDSNYIKFSKVLQTGNFFPVTNKGQDIGGGPGNAWFYRNLYLGGSLIDDNSNSVTIAQLASSVPKTLDSTAVISSWTTTTLVTNFYINEAALSTAAYNLLQNAKSIFIKMSDNCIYPATFDWAYYKIKVIGDVSFSAGSLTAVEIYYQ